MTPGFSRSTNSSTIFTTSSNGIVSRRLSGSLWSITLLTPTFAAAARACRCNSANWSVSAASRCAWREVMPSPRIAKCTSRPSCTRRAAVAPHPRISSSGWAAMARIGSVAALAHLGQHDPFLVDEYPMLGKVRLHQPFEYGPFFSIIESRVLPVIHDSLGSAPANWVHHRVHGDRLEVTRSPWQDGLQHEQFT